MTDSTATHDMNAPASTRGPRGSEEIDVREGGPAEAELVDPEYW
jgi:hypothetical protein